MCESIPPAVRIRPSPAIASVVTPTTIPGVTPAMTSGLPALPMPAMRPPLMPTSALRMPVQSMISALVMTQSSASSSDDARGLTHPVAQHFAAAELALIAVHRGIVFDLGDELGVTETHAIAGRRPEDVGVVMPLDAMTHRGTTSPRSLPGVTGPLAHPLPPRMTRAPAIATSVTVFVSPGSKRTAVPAGISSRMPYGGRPIEAQGTIGLDEVIVTADLNRPVASIGDRQFDRRPSGVELDLAFPAQDTSRRCAVECDRGHADAATGSAGTGMKLP